MKVFGAILLVLLVAGIAIYADAARLPYDHSVSVTRVVAAPQDKVFALITNVARGWEWRPAVKSVSTLVPDKGPDHWVEHLDHGQFMTFLATRTEAPTRREVLLDDPGSSYGGTWIYELSPGPSWDTTLLRITKTGFIKPPIYRFIMAHVIGPTRNLDEYMKDIEAQAETLWCEQAGTSRSLPVDRDAHGSVTIGIPRATQPPTYDTDYTGNPRS
jgi:hypothetical protein